MSDVGPEPPGVGGLDRVDVLLQLRRWDEAIVALRQAVAREPDDGGLWARLAHAHLGAGDTKAGVDAAQRGVALAPSSVFAHGMLSRSLLEDGRARPALQAAFTVVNLVPELADGHLLAGNAALELRDTRTARRAAEAAVRADPDAPEVHNLMGQVLLHERRPVPAEWAFRQALQIDPGFAPAMNNLGIALQAQGRATEAAELVMRAAATRPDEPVYRENVAFAAERLREAPVMAVIAGFLALRFFGLLFVPLAVGTYLAYRWWIRRTARGTDGRPLPDGLWQAADERRRAYNRAVHGGRGIIAWIVLGGGVVLFLASAGRKGTTQATLVVAGCVAAGIGAAWLLRRGRRARR